MSRFIEEGQFNANITLLNYFLRFLIRFIAIPSTTVIMQITQLEKLRNTYEMFIRQYDNTRCTFKIKSIIEL